MRASHRMVAGLLGVMLVTSGCSGGGEDEATVSAYTAHLKEPVDLIPGQTNETQGSTVANLLFAGLTTYRDGGERPANLVAKSLETTDNKTWRVTLRPGWKFHNGEPVTAESFVGAWTATVRHGWRNAYFFTDLLRIKGADQVGPGKEGSELAGLDVVSDTEFTITLDAPNANLPLIVGYTAFYPVPESVLQSEKWDEYRQKPIGNGQYLMAEGWRHDEYIKLAKNTEYAGPDPGKADEITFRIYAKPNDAYSDAVAGNLDVATVPPSRLVSAPQDFPDRYLTTPGSTFVFLGMPLWRKGYKDVRVRRAISMAIDREQIAATLFNKTVDPAHGLVSPLIERGRRDGPCGDACRFRPVAAKELLDEAGGVPGDELVLWYDTGAGHEDWVEAVANQLRRNLRVRVRLHGQPWARYPDLTTEHKVTGPYRLGWAMDYPAAENYLTPLYSTGGSANGTGYSNNKVDELLAKGNAAKSPSAGVPSLHAAEDQILRDMPVVPLWFAKNPYVHSSRVGNLDYDGLGYLEYDQAEVTG